MDFLSSFTSFLTESSMTLDSLRAELWTWELWMARSTVMFMIPWEDMVEETVTGLEDGAGLALLEGRWCRGSEPGPAPIMVLSSSQLMCSAMFLLSILGSPVSGE